MQNLEVISVNVWQILISLANLVILMLLFKKFLYAPVKRTVAARQKAIEDQFAAARQAEEAARADRDLYAEKLQGARAEAEGILKDATTNAGRRSESIVADARNRADAIVRQAQTEAEQEKKKARDTIRQEITEVSAALAEKLLQRELTGDDHTGMINAFLDEMGDKQ